LCFGDNLTFLKDTTLLPDESVDLIYLDPPFNPRRAYNILFKDVDGAPAPAQIQAFEDTWQWDEDARDKYLEIQATAPAPACITPPV
jgi:site-specific DNA-methyltransferase (adenine-specific)